jgi:hypothetical protein
MKIDTDNTIYANDVAGSWGAHNTTYVTGGDPSDVYVERTINSGALTTDGIGASRVQISTDRILQCVSVIDGIAVDANVTVDYYDAPAGGNLLDSAVYDLNALYAVS